MTTQFKDIDSYLAVQQPKHRALLEKIRQTVNSLTPDAVEVISYQMPAFKYKGSILIYFAGFKDHCSLFPGNVKLIAQFKDELKGFVTAKGTIRFTVEKPLPLSLIRKIVKVRMKDNAEKAINRKSRKTTKR